MKETESKNCSVLTIGQAIKKARKSRGFTQAKVAKKLGVAQTTICYWETDRFSPNLMLAICLADVLGITLDELVGRGRQ